MKITQLLLKVKIGKIVYLSLKLLNIYVSVTHPSKLLTTPSSRNGK